MNIRRRKHRGGSSWQLDCGFLNGKRVQLSFKTKADAEDELARRKAKLRESGHQAFTLTDDERVRFATARDTLKAVGATLDEAVAFYLTHARPAKEPVKLSKLIALCLAAKREENLSERYLTQLKSTTESFAAARRETLCTEIRSDDILGWLRANQWQAKTWNNYRTDLRSLFQWGIEQKYLTLNPADAVPRKKLDDHEVAFLSVDDVERLLIRCAAVRPGYEMQRDKTGAWLKADLDVFDFRDCLGMVTLGCFCGLRPEKELRKMECGEIREDGVVVRGKMAKSRSRRVVDLSENAREWLALCTIKQGKIKPRNWDRKWKLLRKAVGLFDAWPHNAMRHTFCTNWLAEHGDEKRLQLLMDHESPDIIYKHYRGQTTRAEARRFWGLRPVKAG